MELEPTLHGIKAQSTMRFTWLNDRLAELDSPQQLYRAFALVPRAPRQGDQPTPGLDDQCRLAILLHAQQQWPHEEFAQVLETLFCTADLPEAVQLYRFLPRLSQAGKFLVRAREGARSNTVPLFEAVAHDNPYPARYFDEDGWNQLVLKAVFLDVSLAPIEGLDQRNSPALAAMLADYVQERWVADRQVPWELWRLIGPHLDQSRFANLLCEAMRQEHLPTRRAASLAAYLQDPIWATKQAGFIEDASTWDWQKLSTLQGTEASHVH